MERIPYAMSQYSDPSKLFFYAEDEGSRVL
jgi:hypothetical protein